MTKINWQIILCFGLMLFSHPILAGEAVSNKLSKEDEEIIKYLQILENYEILQLDLNLMQEYENVDRMSSTGESNE